jgi:hypothetical protein
MSTRQTTHHLYIILRASCVAKAMWVFNCSRQVNKESMGDRYLSFSRSLRETVSVHETIDNTCRVYHRRWYILIVFSLIAGLQGCVWNTWGPITGSAKAVYGWSDGTIALLENWGPITYILSFVLFSWLLDIKGKIQCYDSVYLLVMFLHRMHIECNIEWLSYGLFIYGSRQTKGSDEIRGCWVLAEKCCIKCP